MSTPPPDPSLKSYVVDLLNELRQREQECRRHRVHYMKLARSHGMTYAEIGAALGMSGPGARQFLARSDAA